MNRPWIAACAVAEAVGMITPRNRGLPRCSWRNLALVARGATGTVTGLVAGCALGAVSGRFLEALET